MMANEGNCEVQFLSIRAEGQKNFNFINTVSVGWRNWLSDFAFCAWAAHFPSQPTLEECITPTF